MSEIIDNRGHRIRTLEGVIRHLHEGRAPAEVKARLAALVRECDAGEIAAMEQELMADGVPASEIMGMCDLHSQVVREVLVERPGAPPPPGHPVDVFRRENEALGARCRELREALATLAPAGAADETPVDPGRLVECRRLLAGLVEVDKHYQRKEHLLFPILERHGITGPSTVMWGKDDETRALLKELGTVLEESGGTVGEWRIVVQTVAEPAMSAVEEMIFKEERILLPMSLQTLTGAEWGEIHAQSPELGYCLVAPREGYAPPTSAGGAAGAPGPEPRSGDRAPAGFRPGPAAGGAGSAVVGTGPAVVGAGPVTARVGPPPFAAARRAVPLTLAAVPDTVHAPAAADEPATVDEARPAAAEGRVVFPSGALSLEQLEAIFATLPVDLTFVDADDRVRFFSEGRSRLFARPRAVLGRRVQNCHPPSSVHVVERILSDFRSGRQDVAEFWIEFKGRFAQIRYFALRDAKGTYLGTLEVTQDLTRERALQGERRLLQYES